MAWPKRRRLRRAPFLLGGLLAAGLAAALALDAQGRLPGVAAWGVPLLVAWWAAAATLLAWGLSGRLRGRGALAPLWLAMAALVFLAAFGARSLGGA